MPPNNALFVPLCEEWKKRREAVIQRCKSSEADRGHRFSVVVYNSYAYWVSAPVNDLLRSGLLTAGSLAASGAHAPVSRQRYLFEHVKLLSVEDSERTALPFISSSIPLEERMMTNCARGQIFQGGEMFTLRLKNRFFVAFKFTFRQSLFKSLTVLQLYTLVRDQQLVTRLCFSVCLCWWTTGAKSKTSNNKKSKK